MKYRKTITGSPKQTTANRKPVFICLEFKSEEIFWQD